MPLETGKINVHANLCRSSDIEERIREWQENGIEKTCVCAEGVEQDGEMYTNEKLIPVMRKYSDAIIGIGRIDMGWDPTGPERIGILREHGFVGLYCTRPSYPYDNEIYYPLYETALELDMPLMFETGILPSDPGDRTRGVSADKMRIFRVDGVIRAFPGLRVMISGLGYPLFEEGIALMNTFDTVFGELKGITDLPGKSSMFRKIFSVSEQTDEAGFRDHVLLPFIRKLSFASGEDLCGTLSWYESLFNEFDIDEETQELFYRKNAEEWLGIA